MKKGYIQILLMVMMFFTMGFNFKGCVSIPYESKSKVEQQIAELKKQHQEEVVKSVNDISNQKDVVIKAQDNQLQAAANSLYGADRGFSFYTKPVRLDLIIHNRVLEAQSAIGKAPTYEAIQRENERLQAELDETKTSLEQLKANSDAMKAENTKIAEEKVKQQAVIDQMVKDFAAKDAAWRKKVDEKQDELNGVNNRIIALEKERADKQAAIERLKTKLMWACGIGALLCIAGAVYSPVGKQLFIIIGSVLGLAVVAIPFIEGWMIAVAILVVVLIAAAVFAYKHNLLSKTNKNLVSAIQDDIEKGSTTIKNNVKAWNTKYVKNADGSITEVTDKAIENVIKTTLMEVGRLPTDVNPVAVIKIESPASGSAV
jgi:hypothetical protein